MPFDRTRRREDEPAERETDAPRPAPSTAAQVLALQSSAGNQAVARALAREPAQAAPPPRTANVTLSAIYENTPGTARDKVKRTDADDALWFDPLTMLSNHPTQLKATRAKGIVAGGQKTIDSYAAPVTDAGLGRGSISGQLKYAGQRNKSFDVQVAGVTAKEKGPAVAEARRIIEQEIADYGDAETIAKTAETALKQTYPNATVAINVRSNQVMDAGQTTFYYKVRGDAGILMDIQVVPVGEKHGSYSGSKTTSKGSESESSKRDAKQTEKVDVSKDVRDSERKRTSSLETEQIAYDEAVVRTLDDYVTKSTEIHKQVASDLSEEVVKDDDYSKKVDSKNVKVTKKVEDYTKNVEKGQKDKSNWAAKIKKGIQGVKKVTSIPYIDRIPGIGWFSRRVKGWQLDVAEWVADQFAEEGKVDYENEKIKADTTTTDTTTGNEDTTIKAHSKTETKRQLREDFLTKTKEDWERHLTEVTTVAKDYRRTKTQDTAESKDAIHTEDYTKRTSKEDSEAAERAKTTENQTTTANFQVSTTWKYTAPAVKATVVSGDAEVGPAPFGPDPEESKQP